MFTFSNESLVGFQVARDEESKIEGISIQIQQKTHDASLSYYVEL